MLQHGSTCAYEQALAQTISHIFIMSVSAARVLFISHSCSSPGITAPCCMVQPMSLALRLLAACAGTHQSSGGSHKSAMDGQGATAASAASTCLTFTLNFSVTCTNSSCSCGWGTACSSITSAGGYIRASGSCTATAGGRAAAQAAEDGRCQYSCSGRHHARAVR